MACNEVLAEVAETLRPLATEKGLGFEVQAPASDVIIRTDRRAFSQILINLINNAIKFTETGKVHVELRQSGDLTEVAITDTGTGIAPENQARLFEAFARLEIGARRRQEGSGLGLHLSRKLAEILGGDIRCQSEPGKGSTFTLTISPVASPEQK